MNESIKTFSLVVITICVFIITVLDILEMVAERNGTRSREATHVHDSPSAQPASAIDINTPKTTVRFDELKYDFGEINEGEKVYHTFTFTNTGDHPLLITNAVGSCGCTVPTYSREPIAPGGKGSIEVQFDSKGRDGLQNKNITVSANTEPVTTVLTITSSVKN
jgi:hypothetical protein